MAKESIYFSLEDISEKRDTKELKQELDRFPGVISVSVNAEKNTLAVDFDNTGVQGEQISKRVEKLGYTISEQKREEHIM